MTSSSQNHSGAQPPEHPEPSVTTLQTMTAVAQAAPVPLSSLQVATGVIRAAMKGHSVTAEDIAQAEDDAGILFDPQRAEEIASAARASERGKCQAELAQAEQDREARDWFHTRWRAAGQLCEGRPVTDMLSVGEVLIALDGRAPTTLPLTITWDGTLTGPAGDGPGETTLIGGTTARGGRAVLVLDDEQRLALGEKLLTTVHPAETCPTPGCGTTDAEFAQLRRSVEPGWIFVEVAGADDEDGPRWWCNRGCAYAAMTAAGAEFAAADRAAAVDPDQQAPSLPRHVVDEEAVGDGQEHTDPWPPNGGHDPLCAYASGISSACTCTDANPAGGAW